MERKSLMEYLKGLSDVRKEKGKRHEQEVILVIIIMGLMMGCKSMGVEQHPKEEGCIKERKEYEYHGVNLLN